MIKVMFIVESKECWINRVWRLLEATHSILKRRHESILELKIKEEKLYIILNKIGFSGIKSN